MKFLISPIFSKILIFLTSITVLLILFYFDSSVILRGLSIGLIIIGLISINRNPEIIVLSLIYFVSYDLYNLRYGLAMPLAIEMVIIWILTIFLGYFYLRQLKSLIFPNRNYLFSYMLVWSLVILEIFLIMSFWPVDPRIKAFMIAIPFFLIGKTFYLNMHSMLSLKRMTSFLIISIIIMGIVYSLNYFGF